MFTWQNDLWLTEQLLSCYGFALEFWISHFTTLNLHFLIFKTRETEKTMTPNPDCILEKAEELRKKIYPYLGLTPRDLGFTAVGRAWTSVLLKCS